MAMLISRATGNFTSASTWSVADSATGSQLISNLSASTNTTTSYVYSSTFTGTNGKVVDGVILFIKRLNTTGTFSVALSDDNGVTATREVTVNASDLPLYESWVFFKFSSPLTLDGGTDYRVGVKSSSAANAAVYRDATAGNWGRLISTTDTAAPAAGDTMLIVGELTGAGTSNSYTVTMDNTATTDFGTGVDSGGTPGQTNTRNFNGIHIGQKGTMTWGTADSTNYYLKISGNIVVWAEGTYNMGTTANPCPRTSTMFLQFDNATSISFHLATLSGSTLTLQGQSRTSGKDIWFCKLNTDEAIGSTSLGVDTDTGWLDNDIIGIASTTTSPTQCEAGTLNGAAGVSTLTVDGFGGAGGGLAFAHSGTGALAAEIILLTRNVKIYGSGLSATCFCTFGSSASLSVDVDWVEFNAVQFNLTNQTDSTGSVSIQYSSIRNSNGYGVALSGSNHAGTMVFSNNALYSIATGGNAPISFGGTNLSGTITVSNNILIAMGVNTFSSGFIIGVAGTFSGNTIVGGRGSGIEITLASSALTIDSNIVHSCAGIGVTTNSGVNGVPTVINNLTSWRNASGGITLGASTAGVVGGLVTLTNSTFFGNGTYNIGLNGAIVTLDNVTCNGDTGAGTTTGFRNLYGMGMAIINNSNFGVVSGIYTAHTNDISQATNGSSPMILLNNTRLASATEVASPSLMAPTAYIRSSNHDQTEGAFKSWFQGGLIERDTTIFNTAAPSERLTPSSASVKLASGPRLVAVDDGSTLTISVYVRKSAAGDGAAYNGNQPRLIVRANPACGITSDTVLDTMTVSTGTWEQLTGTTAAVNADGALEFYVDCDGTTGWINVDDWSVS